MYREVTQCRACGYPNSVLPTLKESMSGAEAYREAEGLVPVFDLGDQPLANDFTKPGGFRSGKFPLKVMYCPRCTNAQLSIVVDSNHLYRNYKYVTSQSDMMKRHFASLLELLKEESECKTAVEIGSNDGEFLVFLRDNKFEKVLGIEPAMDLCLMAKAKKVQTILGEFNRDTSALAHDYGIDPDVIVARHVFCHIDDWKAFIKNLNLIAGPKTLIAIEVPHAQELLERVEFDTIYHEHLDYLSINAMRYLLTGTPFHLHRIQKFPIHGGSMVIMIRSNDSGIGPHESVERYSELENINADAWRSFAESSMAKIEAMRKEVCHRSNRGERVVGYGASAKSTVWMSACKFTRREIRWISDSTPEKQGCLSPESNVPIVDPGSLTRELPDAAVCFAWNYWPEIEDKEKLFKEKGGTWIVPHIENRRLVVI